MKNFIRVLAVMVVSVFLSSAFTGCCTCIGYGIGSAADPGVPGTSLRVPGEIDSLEAGTWVRIIRKDSTEVRGKVYAIKLIRKRGSGDGDYPEVYEKWRADKEADEVWPARFGTPVRLALRTAAAEKVYSGNFVGFDSMAVRISLAPANPDVSFDLGYVAELRDAQGRLLANQEALMRTWQSGVPVLSSLKRAILLNTQDAPPISFDEIREVSVLEDGPAKWIGLAMGAAADAALIAVAINDMHFSAVGQNWDR